MKISRSIAYQSDTWNCAQSTELSPPNYSEAKSNHYFDTWNDWVNCNICMRNFQCRFHRRSPCNRLHWFCWILLWPRLVSPLGRQWFRLFHGLAIVAFLWSFEEGWRRIQAQLLLLRNSCSFIYARTLRFHQVHAQTAWNVASSYRKIAWGWSQPIEQISVHLFSWTLLWIYTLSTNW